MSSGSSGLAGEDSYEAIDEDHCYAQSPTR